MLPATFMFNVYDGVQFKSEKKETPKSKLEPEGFSPVAFSKFPPS